MGPYLEVLLIALTIDTIFLIIAYSLKTEALTYLSYSLSIFLTLIYMYFRHSPLTAAMITIAIVLCSVCLGVSLSQRVLKLQLDHRSDDRREPFFRFGAFLGLQAASAWIVPLLETSWKEEHRDQGHDTRYRSVTPRMLSRRTR